jgi:hypothetical protein
MSGQVLSEQRVHMFILSNYWNLGWPGLGHEPFSGVNGKENRCEKIEETFLKMTREFC